MKGTCTICRREDRAEIDAALLLKPLRVVASEFQLPRSTLHSHKRRHVRAAAARAFERVTLEYSKTLRQSMAKVQKATLEILESAKTAGDRPLALEAAKAARENVETMRRLLVKTPDSRQRGKPAAQSPPEIVLEYEQEERRGALV